MVGGAYQREMPTHDTQKATFCFHILLSGGIRPEILRDLSLSDFNSITSLGDTMILLLYYHQANHNRHGGDKSNNL
jgi:hypothetical protein